MPHEPHTAGIVLAAGMSARFGRPKQLLMLNNRYMLEWVLDAALASRLATVVLVLGHEHRRILNALGTKTKLPRVQTVINSRYREGQGRSLQTGLTNVYQEFHSVMFLLGDQPLLRSATIDYLLDRFWNSGKDICIPVCRGKRANPAIFSRALYTRLMSIEGDVGARHIIAENPARVLSVAIDSPLDFFDIDSNEDLAKLEDRHAKSGFRINAQNKGYNHEQAAQ
jgi:molybdenum cofactor cytidylyltransferase